MLKTHHKKMLLLCAVLAGAGALIAVKKIRNTMSRQALHEDRWHSVTIDQPLDKIAPDGNLPASFYEIAEEIEVIMQPAPGGRGTEVAARILGPVPAGITGAATRLAGTDPRQHLRQALRKTKMLAETGEILQPDRPHTTRLTPANIPLALTIKLAQKEGRL